MKKIISILLILLFFASYVSANDIGNTFDKKEYPDSSNVMPSNRNEEDLYIEGGIAKFIDVDLDTCMRLALGNNPKIQAAIQDIFASDYRVKQAWSAWFPTISWQSGLSKIRQLQFSDALGKNLDYNYYVLGTISLSEMLYDFGVTQNRVTVKKLEMEQYNIILTETINTVLRDVKNAYSYVLLANEQVRVAEENVLRYEKFYEQAKAYYQAGVKPKIDLTIAQVNLSNAKLQLIETENSVDIAMAKLNNAIGLPFINRFNVVDNLKYNPCDITLNEAIKIAKTSRPDFKLADVQVQTANQEVKLSKKEWYPKLTVDGDFSIGGKTFTSNYGYNFGAYLKFPTINGMLTRNQIKEAQSIHAKTIATSHSMENDIYLEIQNAYYNMVTKRNKIPVAMLQVKQAQENYNLSSGRYSVGVGDPIELKEAQVQLLNAKMLYNQTLYEYSTTRADLEKAIGKNIVANSIELKKDDIEKIKKQGDNDINKQTNEVKKQEKVKKETCKITKIENEPPVKKKEYKNKFIRGLHNCFSYPDDK